MQGVPRKRVRVGNWMVIAIAAGVLLACVVFAIGNLIF
jgi:hypothetical protein